MESKFQTSFIPKNAIDGTSKVRVKTPFNIFSFVTTLVVIITILASALTFGYSYVLKRQIADKSKELSDKEKAFPYGKVQELVRIDNKIKASSKLLNQHFALTPVFSLLESSTLKNLRFTKFDFSYNSPTRITISMDGEARTFGAVAKQEELFSSVVSKYVKDPVFSDIDSGKDSNKTFSFAASLDPSLIAYDPTKVIQSTQSPTPTPAPETTIASSTDDNIITP